MDTLDISSLEIPLDAEVFGPDGLLGKSTCLVVNPITDTLTDFVLETKKHPKQELLVPIRFVDHSDSESVKITLSSKELDRLMPFARTDYLEVDLPMFQAEGSLMMHPYLVTEHRFVPIETEMIPPEELAVRRGTSVRAKDGRVGRVDEFMVEPKSGHITHLVLREGHLWDPRDVMIPVSAIDVVDEETIQISLSKDEVEALPEIPTRERKWRDHD